MTQLFSQIQRDLEALAKQACYIGGDLQGAYAKFALSMHISGLKALEEDEASATKRILES